MEIKIKNFFGLAILLVSGMVFAQDQATPPPVAQQETATEVEAVQVETTQVEAAQVDADQGQIARGRFTSEIIDREPTDQLTGQVPMLSQLYYFTELQGMSGQRLTHRWEYAGELQAEVSFDVGGDRWRVWSSKKLQPEWNGEWRVTTVTSTGKVLKTEAIKLK